MYEVFITCQNPDCRFKGFEEEFEKATKQGPEFETFWTCRKCGFILSSKDELAFEYPKLKDKFAGGKVDLHSTVGDLVPELEFFKFNSAKLIALKEQPVALLAEMLSFEEIIEIVVEALYLSKELCSIVNVGKLYKDKNPEHEVAHTIDDAGLIQSKVRHFANPKVDFRNALSTLDLIILLLRRTPDWIQKDWAGRTVSQGSFLSEIIRNLESKFKSSVVGQKIDLLKERERQYPLSRKTMDSVSISSVIDNSDDVTMEKHQSTLHSKVRSKPSFDALWKQKKKFVAKKANDTKKGGIMGSPEKKTGNKSSSSRNGHKTNNPRRR
jgi:hypothetical protein